MNSQNNGSTQENASEETDSFEQPGVGLDEKEGASEPAENIVITLVVN